MRTARSAAWAGASETKAQMVFSEMSWKQPTNKATAHSQPAQTSNCALRSRRRQVCPRAGMVVIAPTAANNRSRIRTT
jgi:hypothetical protein